MFKSLLATVLMILPICTLAADKPAPLKHAPSVTDPLKADADFGIQGEYVSEGPINHGALQIVALGDGKFHVVFYEGGLPGAGWKKGDIRVEGDGQTADGATTFKLKLPPGNSTGLTADLVLTAKDGLVSFGVGDKGLLFRRVIRKSSAEGINAPDGALILFDGNNAAEWTGGKGVEHLLLCNGATSKRQFKNFTLHIEFILPYEPSRRGQDRGNSGVYLQGRYEIQVLDSFGLEGKNNECGGIYEIKAPAVNMCFPPLSWQTYDIDYTAAEWDASGVKIKPATASVKHNGVLIHDAVAIPRTTRSAPVKDGPEAGPIYLQDHGHPVHYRNVWIVEK